MAWAEPKEAVERFFFVDGYLRSIVRGWRTAGSYDAWMQALARERLRLVDRVVARLREAMLSLVDFRRRGRWEAFAVDGSRVAVPRTPENEAAFADGGRADGMPQLSMTVLYHLRLGLPWAFVVGRGAADERRSLLEMEGELPAGALLVADSGYSGYDLAAELIARGRPFLMRVGGNVRLLERPSPSGDGVAREFREGKSRLVWLWPEETGRDGRPPIELRLIVVEKPGKKPIYLVTNVLDPERLTAEEAEGIYDRRWGVEVFYRTFKQTAERRTLRSRTPSRCLLELTWALLGVWLLGLMTIRDLASAGENPQAISYAAALKVVRRTLRRQEPPRSRRERRRRRRETRTDGPNASRRLESGPFAACIKDRAQRKGPKATRPYPRKKRQRPLKPPKLTSLSRAQLRRSQTLTPLRLRI